MTLDTAKKSQTETSFLMTTSKAKPGTPLADRVRDQTKELPVAPSAFSASASLSLHFRSPRETCLRPRKLIPNCCEKLDWRNFCLALKYWLKQLLDDSSASIVYEVCECVCAAAVLLGVGGVSACTVDTLTPWRVYCLPSSAAGTCSPSYTHFLYLSHSLCLCACLLVFILANTPNQTVEADTWRTEVTSTHRAANFRISLRHLPLSMQQYCNILKYFRSKGFEVDFTVVNCSKSFYCDVFELKTMTRVLLTCYILYI